MRRSRRGGVIGGLSRGRGLGGHVGKNNGIGQAVTQTLDNGKEILVRGSNCDPSRNRVFYGNGDTGPSGIPPLPPGLSRKRERDDNIAGPPRKKNSFIVPVYGPSTTGGCASVRDDARCCQGNSFGVFIKGGNARGGRGRSFGGRGHRGHRGGFHGRSGYVDGPEIKHADYTMQTSFSEKFRCLDATMVTFRNRSAQPPKILNFSDVATRAVYILNLGENATEKTIRDWIADSERKESITELSGDTQKNSEMVTYETSPESSEKGTPESTQKDAVTLDHQKPDTVKEDEETKKSLIEEKKIKLKEQKKERRKAIRATAAWTQKKLSEKEQNLLDNIRTVVFDTRESNGKSRGNAYIEFTSPISAVLFRMVIEKLNMKNKTAENSVKYLTKFAHVSKAPFTLVKAIVEKTDENTKTREPKSTKVPISIDMSQSSLNQPCPLPQQPQSKVPPSAFTNSDGPKVSPGMRSTPNVSGPAAPVKSNHQNPRINSFRGSVYGSVSIFPGSSSAHQGTSHEQGIDLNQTRSFPGTVQGIMHNHRPPSTGPRIQRATPFEFQAPSPLFYFPSLGSKSYSGSQRGGPVNHLQRQGFPGQPYQRPGPLPQEQIYNRQCPPPQQQLGGYKRGLRLGYPFQRQEYQQGPSYWFQGQGNPQSVPQCPQGLPVQIWQYGRQVQNQYKDEGQYVGQQRYGQYQGQQGQYGQQIKRGPPNQQKGHRH